MRRAVYVLWGCRVLSVRVSWINILKALSRIDGPQTYFVTPLAPLLQKVRFFHLGVAIGTHDSGLMTLSEKRKIAVVISVSAILVFDSFSTDSGGVFFFPYLFPISLKRENMEGHTKLLSSQDTERDKHDIKHVNPEQCFTVRRIIE